MIRYDNGNFGNQFSENLRAKKKPENSDKKTVLFLSVSHSVIFYGICSFMALFCCPNGYLLVEKTATENSSQNGFYETLKKAENWLKTC